MLGNFSFVIPGKLAGSGRPGGYGDPRADLAWLARQGIGAVVTLTEEPLDPAALRDAGLKSLHLPVQDFRAPRMTQMRRFVSFVEECFAQDLAVAVHCGAGMGRTGTMLACYLVSTGMDPETAARTVRRMRPGSIETGEQMESLHVFHSEYKADND